MTTIDFYVHQRDKVVASASLIETETGYTSEWWVSSEVRGYFRVAARLEIPLYGDNPAIASARMRFIANDVITAVSTLWGGIAAPGSKPSDPRHIQAHMEAHLAHVTEEYSDIDKTVAFYELLEGFRVSNPAVRIAELLEVPSIRTVHDRISRARAAGLLDSYGKGRAHGA